MVSGGPKLTCWGRGDEKDYQFRRPGKRKLSQNEKTNKKEKELLFKEAPELCKLNFSLPRKKETQGYFVRDNNLKFFFLNFSHVRPTPYSHALIKKNPGVLKKKTCIEGGRSP